MLASNSTYSLAFQRLFLRKFHLPSVIHSTLLVFVTALPFLFSEATTEIKAFAGSSVDLPCKVDVSQCGDLHSVKWYRDTSRIYVFSQVGGIKRAEGDATER